MKNYDSVLAAKVKGKGDALIILHGLFGSSDNLGRIANELAKDYQVHALDLRNHGQSFHTEEMSYALMANDVIHYMDEEHLDRVTILGHSMGGKVAMNLALIHPKRIDKVIVADIAPITYPPHHNEIFKGLLAVDFEQDKTRSAIDKRLAEYIDTPSVRQFLMKNLEQSDHQQFRWKINLSAIYKNYSKILAGLSHNEPYLGKVLFIGGGLSDYIKPAYKQQTLRLFPKTEMKIIPETTHWLHAEKPRAFIGICQRFLAT
jgi:esterase